ncbi:SRPBCC family protein [Zafaria sp. Z1313]|uniref:SRPBCC family protein n=1 Tax=unclassified Zafaria TaxID=2828765 RepID=UPI002E7A3C56|nr:SRPBCC family protein [Zafaria sp. J156]MEE1621782.1 SRPBCC family protein [Zafaria sp. J156]
MGTTTAYRQDVLVRVPPARAWDLLTDWAAAPAWLPGVTEMHAEGPLGPGTRIDLHTEGHERTFTVADVEPGSLLVVTGGEGDVRTQYRYGIAREGADTRLTLEIDVEVSDSLAALAGDIRAAVAGSDGRQLAAFKRFAERAP